MDFSGNKVEKRGLMASIILFLKGVFMGVADIIPGVSGGTIALIVGIYEELIFSISAIRPRLKSVNYRFFVPLFLGIGIAFLTLAKLMNFLLTDFTGPTYAFFLGLIVASAILLYHVVEKFKLANIFYVVVGFMAAFYIAGLTAMQVVDHSLIMIFFSAILAIIAMILPGISGAFILLLIGQYEFMVGALSQLRLPEISVFAAGAALGIIGFSHVLKRLLQRYEGQTIAFLIGLMLGSLRLPYDKMISSPFSIWTMSLLAVVGFAVVLVVEQFSKKKSESTIQQTPAASI